MAVTVLVVDDDAAVVRPLVMFFELEGFTLITVTNGLEALAYLRRGGDADVILLDLRMPIMDGWGFRREQLRDPAIARIPVVVLSGADEERVAEIGAVAVFQKPVPLGEVLTVLRELCPGVSASD